MLALAVALPIAHPLTARRDEITRAMAGGFATGLAAGAALMRLEAREAALWSESAARADRVAEILAAQAERATTIPIVVAALAIVAVVEGLRLVRLIRQGGMPRPRLATVALAEAAMTEQPQAELDLSIAVDREVRGDALLRVLQIARAAGARQIELLLTRGGSPDLPADAPEEAGIVLPEDFVALRVELADTGQALPADERFEQIAPLLIRRRLVEPGPVRVAAAARPPG